MAVDNEHASIEYVEAADDCRAISELPRKIPFRVIPVSSANAGMQRPAPNSLSVIVRMV